MNVSNKTVTMGGRYAEKIRKWLTFQQAKEKLSDSMSSFVLFRCKRHVVLSPRFLGKVNQGIKESLDSELRMYCAELSGVLVAYDNISILQTTGDLHDEAPYLHFDIEADFVVFRPTIGCSLKGRINKIGEDHIGCVVHGCINASIPLPHNLVESGKFSSLESSVVTSYRELEFEVTDMTNNNRILTIGGKLKGDPQSLENIKLEDIHTRPVSQDGLNNGSFSIDDKDFDFIRTTSKKNHKRPVESIDRSNSQKIPSDPDSQRDSSSRKKKKKRRKSMNDQGERTPDTAVVVKVEPESGIQSFDAEIGSRDTTASSSGFYSSLPPDSELDMSFAKTDSQTKKKKSKKKHRSNVNSDSLSSDTSISSGKKHKHKRSHINVEPA